MIFNSNDVDINKIKSTLLKEYLSFKRENYDSILLFQVGEFFETFFQDAKIFSQITGATLTSRSFKEIGEVAQAGVPVKSVDIYIKKLLNENYKVCLCPQFKDENNNFYRKITRTYTKGTIIENDFLDAYENNYILCAYHKDGICYLSYADVSEGQFYKTKDTFEKIKIEIEKISPDEFLICKNQENIFKDLTKKFNTTVLDEEYFNCEIIENSILMYCENTQKQYMAKLDKIIEYKINTFLTMDEITRRNLELTRTKRFLKKKGSIFWFLNYTKTPMGARLLKKYLSEPLLDKAQIQIRQNAIRELIQNKKLITSFENIMEQFCDLSRICARLSNTTIYPKDLFQLVNNSKDIENLNNLCNKLKSSLFKIKQKELKKVLDITKEIKLAINENTSNDVKSGGIINDNYNSNLDYLRSKLKKISQDILSYEAQQKILLKTDKLKINSSASIGYYIEIPSSRQNSVPKEYLRKQILSSCARYTTEKLKEYEQEYFNLKFQINELEYSIYCEIRKRASEFVSVIRSLAKDIARIDVIVSFSRCTLVNNLSKPNFNSEGLYIKDGFHPSLIKLNNDVIKNDTNIDNSTMMILTGANMSGKSTYLKYNAIICILSQIGCFVPAKSANVTILDKIFLRQGSTDDIVNNISSFMVEMNDLKFIIDNITNSSLVLLDEPAKSTNAKEGAAIALAFCEYLLNHFEAKTIVVTHNLELTNLENKYPKKAYNYVIGSTNQENAAIQDRKLKRGVVQSSFAINTAILAQLPAEIINNAKSYLNINKV